jgi:NAD(P)H-flavin reductase
MIIQLEKRETTYTYQVKTVYQVNDTIFKVYLFPVLRGINYLAGQYCYLLCVDNKFRPYSITNCPDLSNGIELHIRVTERNFSMKQLMKVGKLVTLKGPYGKYINSYKQQTSTILIAEGIGLAAFYSILNSKSFACKNCLLLWLRRIQDHHYAATQIEEWIRKIKNFIVYNIEFSDISYSEILEHCNNFFIMHRKIQLHIAGSITITNYLVKNFNSNKDVKIIG